jgi:hypothetical protein
MRMEIMTNSRRCDGRLGSEMDEAFPYEGLGGCGRWKGIRTPRTKKPRSDSKLSIWRSW